VKLIFMVQMDLISEDRLAGMPSMEKIRLILDEVRKGKILVLERGLTPAEQAKLIEITMAEISEGFKGIEIESYPSSQESGIFYRLFGKSSSRGRLTVIGPAGQLKTVRKERDLISALVTP